MEPILIEELEKIADSRILTWDIGRPIYSIVKNPDEQEENCLYFCFEKEEETSLLKKAVKSKVAGIVVPRPCRLDIEKWKQAGIGIIEVGNPVMYQIALAEIYRAKFDIPFIQVIGSAGKTTVKDMIGAVLGARMPVLVGYKNYNTAYGAASNILNLRNHHRAAVLEAGMKSPGYMRYCSRVIRPNLAVLTSIQRAHYVTMGSLDHIIEAKAEILEYLDENGVLILNGDDVNCSRFPVQKYKGRILRYGFSDKYDIWASHIYSRDFNTYFTVYGAGKPFDCMIHTVGKYNVGNALAAVLVGLELNLTPEVIRRGLAAFRPMTRRLKIYNGPLDTILIDDNFNANPDSVKLLLEEIPKFAENRPVMLVMGDVERPDDAIREYAEPVHFHLGQLMAKTNFNRLIAVGKWARKYISGAASAGVPATKMAYFKTVEQAEEYFKSSIIPGSMIVFKASVYVTVRDLMKSLDEIQ